MDKVESKEIVKTEVTHNFFCDYCNTSLGSSTELEDGYYDHIGRYVQSFYLRGIGNFSVEKCLCNKCKAAYNNRLLTCLVNDFGFKFIEDNPEF